LLRAFAEHREQAVAGYRRFVCEGINARSPLARSDEPGLSGIGGVRRTYAERWSERDQAIADHFGVGRMTVSRAVKNHEVRS
jgi:hypothetical protein